jgi:CrcB protein
LIEILLVAVLGSAGALLRYHFGGYVHASVNQALSSEREFPFGTMLVNMIGSLFMGALAGFFSHGAIPQLASVVLGVGFCGSLTTFSTLAVDLQRFIQDRRFLAFASYLICSIISGLGATLLGLSLALIFT